MNGLELSEALLAKGMTTGWIIRDAKIVFWDNESPVPNEFLDFVELDEEIE
jgi:hypothetical protein